MDVEEWTEDFLTQIDNSLVSHFDMDDKEDFKLTTDQENSRFGELVNENELRQFQQTRIPKNTSKNTRWCVNLYDTWAHARNNKVSRYGTTASEKYVFVPPLSTDITSDVLDFWMCRFVCEVRRQDGSPYPAMSLKNICIGIWRYIRDEYKRYDLNLFDQKLATFADFRATLDAKMKNLNSDGVGVVKRQSKPVSRLEEEKLWDTGVFGMDDAQSLFNAVYFYNCKVFGLRAADEHSNLNVANFHFGYDDQGEYVEFRGGTCKNNQGGLKQGGKVAFRQVRQYAQPTNSRCYLKLLRRYLQFIPAEGSFYRRPLLAKGDQNIRFSQQKVGLHTFEKLFGKICLSAGLEGRHTGHSGKVTTATRLFNEKVDEQLVMERTGHRSTAVRAYKRTSSELQQRISNILQPPMPQVKNDDDSPKPKSTKLGTSSMVTREATSVSKCSPSKKRVVIKYCNESGETIEISM